jgi:hypothetical protein
MDLDSYLNEIDRYPFPTIRYRLKVNYGLSVVNFFAMAMGLFMIAAPMMGWIDYQSPTLGTAYMFGGFCEYLIGYYDWYAGKSVLSFIDFIFGLLHFTFYYTADLGKYNKYVPENYYTYMQGTFYCLWLALLLFLILSMSGRGFFYIMNFFFIFLACLFALIWHFSKRKWARQTSGYFLFFASLLLWLTGLCHLMNGVLRRPVATCVTPYP